ncbi:MAG: hypothetical protein WBG46_06990 [Nonlabens sp.]
MGILSEIAKAYNFQVIKSKKLIGKDVKTIHRLDHRNAGDLYSAPYHYYKELCPDNAVDIYAFKKFKGEKRSKFMDAAINHKLIIGGGGLLNTPTFDAQMKLFEYLSRKGKKVVFWGLGHNSGKHHHDANLEYNINTEGLDMFSSRDHSKSGDYVPCVSCKHPLLDGDSIVKQELGVVFHKKTLARPHVTTLFDGIPKCDNTQSIENIIDFIKSSEKIITNSYHAMYWSLLLGKKVAVIGKNSKYHDFHNKPIYTTFENSVKDVNKAQSISGLLSECRELNDRFAKKAFEYLEIA